MTSFSTKEIVQEDIDALLDSLLNTGCKLVVHNDEENTFEWVIKTLVDICQHSWGQAEQCAMIIHNKGKYAVKEGAKSELKPMKDAIVERGIGATLE